MLPASVDHLMKFQVSLSSKTMCVFSNIYRKTSVYQPNWKLFLEPIKKSCDDESSIISTTSENNIVIRFKCDFKTHFSIGGDLINKRIKITKSIKWKNDVIFWFLPPILLILDICVIVTQFISLSELKSNWLEYYSNQLVCLVYQSNVYVSFGYYLNKYYWIKIFLAQYEMDTSEEGYQHWICIKYQNYHQIQRCHLLHLIEYIYYQRIVWYLEVLFHLMLLWQWLYQIQ